MNIKYIILIIILIINIVGCKEAKDNNSLKWTSINVCTPKPQGDAHLITKGDKAILIDGGEYNQGKNHLIPLLKRYKIDTFDEVLITHPHYDHYGGIIAILEDNSFKIKKLYMNMPTKEQMKKEWWGGKYKDLLYIRQLAQKKGIPIYKIKQGDIFRFDKDSFIKVLYIYDGIHTPVGKTDINDMSAIIMIYDYHHRYLLAGDLNKKLGTYLAKNAKDIKAEILKVPHHGAEGLAPNSFFYKVGAKYFIIPAPSYFWQEPKWTRSDRVKKYIQDNNITAYINGIDGDITVVSNNKKFYFIIEPPKLQKNVNTSIDLNTED